MTITQFATLSNIDLAIAEVQGKVKVTRLASVKPRKSDLVMTQTKGNRCRTNRSSGTNFVTQVCLVSYIDSCRRGVIKYTLPSSQFTTLSSLLCLSRLHFLCLHKVTLVMNFCPFWIHLLLISEQVSNNEPTADLRVLIVNYCGE
jgi:hypothetical protein